MNEVEFASSSTLSIDCHSVIIRSLGFRGLRNEHTITTPRSFKLKDNLFGPSAGIVVCCIGRHLAFPKGPESRLLYDLTLKHFHGLICICFHSCTDVLPPYPYDLVLRGRQDVVSVSLGAKQDDH